MISGSGRTELSPEGKIKLRSGQGRKKAMKKHLEDGMLTHQAGTAEDSGGQQGDGKKAELRCSRFVN